jgi:hypothetical protein
VYKEFKTWKEADQFLVTAKSAGQKDAFVTVTYRGKRYYLKDMVDAGVLTNMEQ